MQNMEMEKKLQLRSLKMLKINIQSKLINLIKMRNKKTLNGVKSYKNYKKKQTITYKPKISYTKKTIGKDN